MILSRGRRYLFIHIPKTGGTALTLALEARAMKDDILIGDTPKARARRRRQSGLAARGRLWKHSTLADLDGLVTPADLDDLFVLTLVRNPWDRVVSYYHWLRAQSFDHPAVILAKRHDFTGFLTDPATIAALGSASYATYVTDARGRERCRLFARIEHQDHDLAEFESHLGFAITPLVRTNTSERSPDYRQYFTNETADLVSRIAAPDISRFGYSF
jgi:hypothetical protein